VYFTRVAMWFVSTLVRTLARSCAYFFLVCQSTACDSVTFAVGPVVVVVVVLGAVRVRVFVG